MNTPILETERLILRPFCLEDAKDVFECWESDPDVAKYMFWTSHNDKNKTIEWIKSEVDKLNSNDWYRWAFILKTSHELLGTGVLYLEEEYDNMRLLIIWVKRHGGRAM